LRAPHATSMCPDGCSPAAQPPPPRRGQQSCRIQRQLVIGKRSPEYHALRGAGLINKGTSTPRIDDPCAGRGWNRQYHLWRRLLHRMAMTLVLHSPRLPVPALPPGIRCHGRCGSCPARLGSHPAGKGAWLLSCGDVEDKPGPPLPDWGEEDNAFLTDLVQEACARLGIAPVRNDFASPTNRRFPALWAKAQDAFAQARDYPSAGALWANPPFSRLDEVVTKASSEGCMMMVVAPE